MRALTAKLDQPWPHRYLVALVALLLAAGGCTGASGGSEDATVGSTDSTTTLSEPADEGPTTLAPRLGNPPEVTDGVPHIQLTQTSPDDILSQLIGKAFDYPDVAERESTSSLPGAVALTVAPGVPARRGAMITGREFAHIHASPNGGGSLHMRLSAEDVQLVLDTGWGVLHPWAVDGTVPNLVMVFAPRDLNDLGPVLFIIELAVDYALTPGDDPLTERPNVQG